MKHNNPERLLYRPSEAAASLGISRAKLYQMIATGEIPSVRVGGTIRVPVQALQDWINRQLESARSSGEAPAR